MSPPSLILRGEAMDTPETPETTLDVIHIPSDTDHLDQIAPLQPEVEDDDFSDDPNIIFRREYSKLDTIPLTQSVPLRVYMLFLLMFASFIGGAIIGLVTYPTVTITLVSLSKTVTYTTPLDLPTRTLAPITITRSQTTSTTGKGHQNARAASGILTFYNGNFSSQLVPAGTIYTGSDGVKIITSEAVTIPAANPPYLGQATVQASARRAGSVGNIQAYDVNGTVSNAIVVKNLVPFTGGRDARDFQAVAQRDLDTLTATLKTALVESIPQAFSVQPGETVTPTNCMFRTSTDHRVGEEATIVTIQARYTCRGMAYNQRQVQQQATAALTRQTTPGANYTLLGTTAPQVISLTPFTVRLSGTWIYVLPQDYERYLAQQIAGKSQAEARAYLLHTGVITRATVPAALPKDPGHIHFVLLIGG